MKVRGPRALLGSARCLCERCMRLPLQLTRCQRGVPRLLCMECRGRIDRIGVRKFRQPARWEAGAEA